MSLYWKNILKKILIILGILSLYKLLTYAILPGVTLNVIKSISQQGLNMTNLLFSGGAAKYSIMAAGIQPYISATMVMQILTSDIGFKKFQKLKTEQGGNILIGEYTQYIMLIISALQGIYIAHNLFCYGRIGQSAIVMLPWMLFYLTTMISIMCGSMLVLWMGNYISSLGFGSGTSFIICANILSGGSSISTIIDLFKQGTISKMMLLVIVSIFIVISFIVVTIENAKSYIMVCYPNVEYSSENTSVARYIPLKINNAGIIPLVMCACIFEISMLLFNILDKMGWYTHHIKHFLLKLTNPSSIIHYIFYAILLLFFTYKYTDMSFNPKEISQNLYLSGVVVDGVRPMKDTEQLLRNKLNALNALTFIIYLLICLFPSFLSYYINNQIGYQVVNFGNSSLIILISTIESILESIRKHVYNFYDVISEYMVM